jgi:hypothetical protein
VGIAPDCKNDLRKSLLSKDFRSLPQSKAAQGCIGGLKVVVSLSFKFLVNGSTTGQRDHATKA